MLLCVVQKQEVLSALKVGDEVVVFDMGDGTLEDRIGEVVQMQPVIQVTLERADMHSATTVYVERWQVGASYM